jgi:outer membrane protein TolC
MADRLKRPRPNRVRPWLRRLACAAVALGCAAGLSSCTRSYFRQAADKEVDAVLCEKDKYPKWGIQQYHVYPDPRARFADPTDPDRPPMPPDDPAAHDLSPNPQKPGKAGVARVEGQGYLQLIAHWDEENRAEAAKGSGQAESEGQAAGQGPEKLAVPPREGPPPAPGEKPPAQPTDKREGAAQTGEGVPASSPRTETASYTTSLSPPAGSPKPYLLKLEQAVELGLINSREYQDAREDLYLTALPVTLERFAFAPQVFAVIQAIRERAGRETPSGPRNDWTLNSNAGVAKLFSTGALLLFNFANQTVLNLGGVTGRPVTSQSTINLDLLQPLLRGGGRAVTLEPLTLSERDLLYEVRNFARFREEFYVAIAGGGGGSITGANFQPTGVIAPAGFTPGAGLGTTVTTAGIVPPVNTTGNPGLQVGPGPAGRFSLTTALAAPVSGYLTTLLQAAQMKVAEYNLQKLEGYVDLSRNLQEGGIVTELQTEQFEQQVLLRRTSLLASQVSYLSSLDQFKLQLGLPTNLRIELEDSPFRALNEQFRRYEDLFREFEAAEVEPNRFGSPEQVDRVRTELRRIFTTSAVVKGLRFPGRLQASWGAWEKLSADGMTRRLADLREERRQLLGKQTDLEVQGKALSAADQQRLETIEFELSVGAFEQVLREYEGRPWRTVADAQVQHRRQQALYQAVVFAFTDVLVAARTERLAQIRRSWPDLARLCVKGVDLLKANEDEAEDAVIQAALTNRLDLMNVRAQTVDAWRQVAVFANALLGTFNVEYQLNSFTPPGLAEPFAFAGSRTTHQLVLNGQLPIVRVGERNGYRAALINFQRSRRILQRAEDQVMFDTRGEIRSLRQQEELYRIQQEQVELAYKTVENSLDTFRAPPQVLPAGQAGTTDAATRAAALASQLITAQTALYTAQTNMTNIWITYLNTRLQLYRDMELMPLDFRGVWIDDVATCECPDGRDRNAGAGPGNGTGERGAPADTPDARPERLPEPTPLSGAQVKGPWLDDSN